MNKAQTASKAAVADEFRWRLLQRKAEERRVVGAFSLFREHSIEPILIKGLAAAQWYPHGGMRLSTDADLAVSDADHQAAEELRTSDAAANLTIDLHRELRHLDTVAWDDLFSNSHHVSIAGVDIRVLRPEDHLRVLIVHWLTDGGSDRERLWDIYYAVENRPTDFDWERFLNVVSKNRRRWLICAIGLAHHFLGLDLKSTPIEMEALDSPSWIIKAVEDEWSAEIPNLPLETTIFYPRQLAQQVKKRLRPNPIWATVQMEGSFDARTRFFYQLLNLFQRIPSSYRRIASTIKHSR